MSVRTLRGIGPATASALGRLGIRTVGDLAAHLPRDYEDRKTPASFSSVGAEGTVNTVMTVVEHRYFLWNRRRTLKVIVTDGTEPASLVCFGRNFLAKLLVPGRELRVYGRFQRRHRELQSATFTVERVESHTSEFDRILPIYPLTSGITQRTLRRAVQSVLDRYGDELEEEIPEYLRLRRGLACIRPSIESLHFPDNLSDIQPARKSLAYRELFYLQLVMQRRARSRRAERGFERKIDRDIVMRIIARLPFSLTADQERAIGEIGSDLSRPLSMMRLLQGDVGCGKTLVALLAAALVTSGGEQAAFMAPTELLARQQAETAAEILEPAGIRVGFIAGSVSGSARGHLLEALASGEIDVVVGTHALFSEDVSFASLGLVVIDEQHRFGVLQRLAIVEKGPAPDLLLMTATPIPRSLALTVFGDLDTTTIRTMPRGRLPVRTHLARIGNETKVYDRVRRELAEGRQAFFVYPLIEESEHLDLKHAEGMYEELRRRVFPEFRTALIHSRIGEEEKRERMRAFAGGEVDLLVATSVVEVGVDVPNATCIVIEHAERFGLAALHQLRGRVGRSSHQAYAFLVYDPEIPDTAKRRLRTMMDTNDGFEIAEEDLRMRGPGELTGIHQTGALELSFANIMSDMDRLKQSREDVLEVLHEDPGLLLPKHREIREVLSRCPPFADTTTKAG